MSNNKYTLNDFERLITLGTGTFGRVFLTRFRRSDQYFAMKVMKKSEIVRLKQVEHINSEKNIISKIHHPFIVNMLCTFQDPQNLYMLMEYIIGGELFSHLRRAGRFNVPTAKFYASEVFLAIDYMHSLNIVYRDLKPENILLDSHGHVKITDFGFSKYLGVENRTWTLCGTPEYLAPEIIQSKGHGKAVDWWALGILIYEMLQGYPPFFDDNAFGIYEKILDGKIYFPEDFDIYAKDLIRRLLMVDRSRRLGNLQRGSLDIKNHSWFNDVNWNGLLNRSVLAPIVPICCAKNDTRNFERYEEPPPDIIPENMIDPYENLFINF